MKAKRTNNRGSVLWVALIGIIVAMGIAMSQLQTSVSNFKSQDEFTTQSNSFFTTHGATELVMSDLYGRFSNPAQTTSKNFNTWLNGQVTFTAVSSTQGDKIANDLRSNFDSYTLATTSPIPTKDNPTIVYRAIPTTYNGTVMGDRMITAVRLYKKERPQPGHFIFDLLVVVETQANLGTTAANQATLVSGLASGRQSIVAQPQWESQLFNLQSPPPFNGFDYAILTKELTCTLCHMHARSRGMLDNLAATKQTPAGSKTQFGNFDRVKVGITEFLGVRSGSEYSQIDGTLFHRGVLQYEGGHANMTAAQFVQEAMSSVAFNGNSVSMTQDANGALTSVPFVNGTTDSNNNTIAIPDAFENLYVNYPTTALGQSAGVLPLSSAFPLPFPEIPTLLTVGTTTAYLPDNQISSDEIKAVASDLDAYSNPTTRSSITGGSSITLAAGQNYLSPNLPTGTAAISTSTGNVNAAPANIVSVTGQAYEGTVIMTGTQANPITIDGKVLINGDVVIRGYVQGTGQIFATGNIYAPGDVIYNDTGVGTINEKFGVNGSSDPAKQQNLLALVAGKNIVIGDYLSQVTHWNSGNSDFFMPYTYDKGTNTVTPNPGRPEPGKPLKYDSTATTSFVQPLQVDSFASVTLPTGVTVKDTAGNSLTKVKSGKTVYVSDNTIESKNTSPSGNAWGSSNFANFTIEQMSYFNRNELTKVMPKLPTQDPTKAASYTGTSAVTNPNYDPTYIPKFYSLYPYVAPVKNASGVITTAAPNPALAFIYSGSTWDNTAGNSHWNGTDDPHGYEYMTGVDDMPAGSLGPGAAMKNVINIHPSWITPDNMMRVISDEQDKHVSVIADPVHGDSNSAYSVPDRRIDGILYTKNAIFAIDRKQYQAYNATTGYSKAASKSKGFMQVNGALIAPDTGILVTGDGSNNSINDKNNRQAFIVNYDARAKTYLNLGSQDFKGFSNWSNPIRKGIVRMAAFMPPAP